MAFGNDQIIQRNKRGDRIIPNPHRVPEKYRSTGTQVADWIGGTGGTEYDYPELPGTAYKGRPVNWLMSPALFDEERKAIFERVTGNTIKVEVDKYGNPYIVVGKDTQLQTRRGKKLKPGSYYLDKPGLTGQTLRTAATNIGISALPAAWLGRAGQGARALASLGRGAVAGGGMEAGREAIASAIAQKNLIHPQSIGIAAAGGAGLHGASRAVNKAVGAAFDQATVSVPWLNRLLKIARPQLPAGALGAIGGITAPQLDQTRYR